MTELLRCPQCGAELPADAPSGLCPGCLLKQGLGSKAADRLAETAAPGSRFTAPPPSELARCFPQLELLELLGQGGMGAVYKARQLTLDRLVALKILPAEVGRDPAFTERFAREARALARLSHPNIVGIYDFGQIDGLYYFVMEYVDGLSLRQLVASRQLGPERALALVPQICEALQFAHDEGIVHRDVKPENILLDKRGRVKIADFGLAKLLGRAGDEAMLTRAEQVMGTPLYMAPEQMQGSHSVDHRADIYSLGVVFYEMLTGELPLGRFAPPSHKVRIDVRLDEVVLRTLEREPDLRYQHASDVKTEVESIVASPALAATMSAKDAALTTAAPCPPVHPNCGKRIVWAPAACLFVVAGMSLVEVLGIAIWLGPAKLFSALLTLHALFLASAATLMLRLRARRDALFAMILAGVVFPMAIGLPPLELWPAMIPLWLGMPATLWAVATLFRPEVREAFASATRNRPAQAAVVISARNDRLRDARRRRLRLLHRRPAAAQVRGPAIGLLITGILNCVWLPTAGGAIAYGMATSPQTPNVDFYGLVFVAVAILMTSACMIAAAMKMMRCQAYRLSIIGCVLAMVVGPGNVIGLPIGVWALLVLTRRDVRRAFRRTTGNRGQQAGEVEIIPHAPAAEANH